MTLTEKEIKTLNALNAKKEIYEYVEVKVLGLGGVEKTINKLVKIAVKKEAKTPAYFDKSLGLVGNDGIMKFVKTEKEIARQERENKANLPSSMRN